MAPITFPLKKSHDKRRRELPDKSDGVVDGPEPAPDDAPPPKVVDEGEDAGDDAVPDKESGG